MVRDTERRQPVGNLTVECAPCVVCGISGLLEVRKDGYLLWQAGLNVQEALPELEPDQRELLLSGVHAHCFTEMFGEDDE
jgi:hypothetical protein